MKDISTLRGITHDETQKLRDARIVTIQDLWNRIGRDFDQGISQLADLTQIKPERLLDLLATEGAQADPDDLRGRTTRHALDLILGVGLLCLAVLLLRALGVLAFLPAPLGLREAIVQVAARDLQASQVLQAGDLYGARLPSSPDMFTASDQLEGLILARQVSRGRPLRHEDVLRAQVIAATDISSGTLIARTVISYTWSVYQPGAAIQIEQVAGHRALQNLRAGEAIRSTFVSPEQVTTP